MQFGLVGGTEIFGEARKHNHEFEVSRQSLRAQSCYNLFIDTLMNTLNHLKGAGLNFFGH